MLTFCPLMLKNTTSEAPSQKRPAKRPRRDERSKNNSPSKPSTTKIDKEYHSTDNESEIDSGEDMLDEKEYEKEIQWRKRKKKIEQALPELMASVKEAAEAHSKAMAKWEKNF
ncbi:hypothetical protein AC249_AIPGENE22103 [Exaiptasia diaphana]|nr:hypothetical protein AC249_AIPGENE22103 [Exaiptasia diaphana]